MVWYNAFAMHDESKPESLWSEIAKHPLLSGGMLVCFIGAIGFFFGPRIVGLALLFLSLVFWFLILVSAESLRGSSNRWRVILRACLVCAGVFVLIGYAGTRWGPGARANPEEPNIAATTHPSVSGTDIAKAAPSKDSEQPPPPQQSAARSASTPAPKLKAAPRVVPGETPPPPLQQTQPAPLPLKRVTIASQEQVNPTKQDALFATKVVVATTAEIHPAWLVLMCDAQVTYAEVYMNQGAVTHTLTNLQLWRSQDGKTFWLSFTEPAFLPETPLVFTLSGKAKIVAQSVDEGRPPADAKMLRATGLQIAM